MNQKLTGKSRKRFLALSLGLALTGCDLFHEATDTEHVAKAKEFLDENDFRAGSIELKSALQKNPGNAEARRLLGEVYVTLGDDAAAEKELRRAIELGVAREAVLLSLAEALLSQGKNQQILDEIEIDTPSSLGAKEQATLIAYRGDAWLGLNKLDNARTEYDKSLQIDPTSARAKLGHALLMSANHETDKAIALAEEASELDPKDGRAWSLLAAFYKVKGELEKADAAYGKAIEHQRLKYIDRANRALVRVELKNLEGAADDIEVAKKEAPKYFLTHFADGYLKIAQNKLPEAQSSLEQSLSLNDRYPFTLFYLGLVNLTQNRIEQAEELLARFKAMVPNSIQAHQMLALVKFKRRDFRAAKLLLMPVILSQPSDAFSLNLMGNIEFASGNSSEGLKYLQKAAELEPTSAAVKTRLGIGLLLNGQNEQGLEVLKGVLEKDPQFEQADIIIALAHMRAKEFDRARAVIDRLKAKLPDQAVSFVLEALLYEGLGDEEKAKAVLEQALTLSPGDLAISENLARLAYKAKRFDDVRRLYEGALKTHPKHPLVQLRLAELDLREGKFKEMEGRLDTLIREKPEMLEPRLVLARYWLRFGQPERSQTLLEEVRSRYPDNPELLAVLAEAQLEANQGNRALETAKALEKIVPQSAMAQYLLAKAYAENADVKNLRNALERALQNDPKFLPSRLAMVKLLAMEKKTEQVRSQLAQLAKDYPDDPEVLSLMGWWAMQQGQPKQAAESYRAALAKVPSSSLVMNVATALWQSGEEANALKTLEDWNQRYPRDAAVHYLRSGFYLVQGKEEEAKKELATVLEINPRSIMALNDLAWLMRKTDPEKALAYAEKAYEQAPKAFQVMDTLAVVNLENRNVMRALQLLKEAATLAPQEPSVQYHLAIAQEKNGLKQEAIATLKNLTQSKRMFPERQEAEALLKTLNGKNALN